MTRLSRKDLANIWFTFVGKHGHSKAIRLFAQLIIDQKRQMELTSIVEAIRRLEYQRSRSITVSLITAKPINEKLKQEIIELMKKNMSAQSVHLQTEVNSEIVGGFIAQANDLVIDASLRRSLSSLEAL